MSNTEDIYSCECEFSKEELSLFEEIARQYDEVVAKEMEINLPEIGYCGFPCDGKCQTCGSNGSYDTNDEY